MTADKYLTFWCSNDDWWDYDESGIPVVLPTAPDEAKKSYQYYLENKRDKNCITSAIKGIRDFLFI